MPARRSIRPRASQVAKQTNLTDPTTSRAVDEIRSSVQQLQQRPSYQVVTQDLIVGSNAIQHGLGRAPSAVIVTPTVADATFAYGVHKDNPHPERQVLLDVVGVPQPGATILVM